MMDDYISSSTIEDSDGPTPADVPLVHESRRYRVGDPQRPDITHDNGFLDVYERREPTAADRAALAKWRIKLNAAALVRRDLADATAAYRHFLDGNGEDRTISYIDYLKDDPAGRRSLQSIIQDFTEQVEVIGKNRENFRVTSEVYAIGSDSHSFPYPETENWQKTLGGHVVWVSADVKIRYRPSIDEDWYEAQVTIHMEDMYNFNPGQSDMETGIPDSENGRFEITGLGHQYMHYGTYSFPLEWKEGSREVGAAHADQLQSNSR